MNKDKSGERGACGQRSRALHVSQQRHGPRVMAQFYLQFVIFSLLHVLILQDKTLLLSSLLVGSAGEVRIKPVPGYLLEQQNYLFCCSSSCLVMSQRGCEPCLRNRTKEGCLIWLVSLEKLHSLISSKKDLWSQPPPTCDLQYSQFCTAYNDNTTAIIVHLNVQGALSSPEKQQNCSWSFPTFTTMQRHGCAGCLGLRRFQPICWNKGTSEDIF